MKRASVHGVQHRDDSTHQVYLTQGGLNQPANAALTQPTPGTPPNNAAPRDIQLYSLEHRKTVRKVELEQAMQFFGLGKRVLEIGAGAGWQANILTSKGYQVTAIDIPESNYAALRERHITIYDGIHIPAPDRYFDVIFSSNVLEHVTNLSALKKEMFRVLKPGGTAVHIIPTSTWRLWTSCGFYLTRAAQLVRYFKGYRLPQTTRISHHRGTPSLWIRVRRALFPATHGARGSWLSELYLFSEHRWRRALCDNYWKLLQVQPNELLYSGHKLFGDRLSLELRHSLSRALGSSCKIYVFKRSPVSTRPTTQTGNLSAVSDSPPLPR